MRQAYPTWRSPPPNARSWTTFTKPRWQRAAKTTAPPACARNTIPTITARSSSIPTATTSRRCAIRRRRSAGPVSASFVPDAFVAIKLLHLQLRSAIDPRGAAAEQAAVWLHRAKGASEDGAAIGRDQNHRLYRRAGGPGLYEVAGLV